MKPLNAVTLIFALLFGVLYFAFSVQLAMAGRTDAFLYAVYAPPKQIYTAPAPKPPQIILHTVPFTSQAPRANWAEPRFQDGCEEAAGIMANAWVKGTNLPSPQEVEQEIFKMAEFGATHLGTYQDTSAADTAKLFIEYFGLNDIKVVSKPTAKQIVDALKIGKIVVAPTNGKRLKNPNYKNGGPLTHILLIRGYDEATDEFITNDPGTRLGNGYRYDSAVLLAALQNYPSGFHLPQVLGDTAVIIIGR